MHGHDATSPAREPFLGARWRSASAGGFAVTLWFAETYGDDVEEHEHEHAHLMIVLGGSYHSRAAGADRDASPIIFNPPKTGHRDRFLTPGSFMSIAVSAERWNEVAAEPAPAAPVWVSSGGARGLVSKLMRNLASDQGQEPLVSESFCTELIGLALPGAGAERRRPPWLGRAIEALTADLAGDASLACVARAAGVHPCHMTRSFRAFERCTPGEYRVAARLQRAAELLAEARLSLAEVALAAGFADQSHFCRRFRGGYGLTPGEYRSRTARRCIPC